MFRLVGVAVFLGGKIFAGRIYSRHAESGLVNGRGVGFVRSRFGAVTARAESAFGRAGLFVIARKRRETLPFSPRSLTR